MLAALLMEVLELLDKLEKSTVFRDWAPQHNGYYLAHVLFMTRQVPQIGYYCRENDSMFTFEIGDGIVATEQPDVFKKNKIVDRLDIRKVKIDKTEALAIVSRLKQDKYPGELLDHEIILLQNFSRKHIYNITYFTKAFKTLNVKINAGDGKVMSDELASLVTF
jgi:hypothetical protein